MLSFEAISKKFTKTAEKTIKVEAWGGDVKIRKLTLSEAANVQLEHNKQNHVMAETLRTHYALVEPAIPLEELIQMHDDVFLGVHEISTAVIEFDHPKKSIQQDDSSSS